MLDLLDPYLFVHELAENVKADGEDETQEKEEDSLWQVQDVENWVHPNVGLVLDHMNPAEVSGHENAEPSESGFSARIIAVRCKHLHNDEDHDVSMHNVVQPSKSFHHMNRLSFNSKVQLTWGRTHPKLSGKRVHDQWRRATRR